MTDLRKAAEMALEALEGSPELLVDWLDKLREVREALRQALAQPEWVGLTDEEIDGIYKTHHDQYGKCQTGGFEYERTIEAKLKEKNT